MHHPRPSLLHALVGVFVLVVALILPVVDARIQVFTKTDTDYGTFFRSSAYNFEFAPNTVDVQLNGFAYYLARHIKLNNNNNNIEHHRRYDEGDTDQYAPAQVQAIYDPLPNAHKSNDQQDTQCIFFSTSYDKDRAVVESHCAPAFPIPVVQNQTNNNRRYLQEDGMWTYYEDDFFDEYNNDTTEQEYVEEMMKFMDEYEEEYTLSPQEEKEWGDAMTEYEEELDEEYDEKEVEREGTRAPQNTDDNTSFQNYDDSIDHDNYNHYPYTSNGNSNTANKNQNSQQYGNNAYTSSSNNYNNQNSGDVSYYFYRNGSPNILVAPLYDKDDADTLAEISQAAAATEAQFIILLCLQSEFRRTSSWRSMSSYWRRFRFWWSQRLPILDQYLDQQSGKDYSKSQQEQFFLVVTEYMEGMFLYIMYVCVFIGASSVPVFGYAWSTRLVHSFCPSLHCIGCRL